VSDADPRLDAALRALADDGDDAGVDGRLDALRASLAQEGGLARLKSLSTPARLAAVTSLLAVIVALTIVFSGRPDLGVYPAARLTVEMAVPGILALALALVALRGPHRPPPATGLTWGLAGAAVLLPLAMAFLPPADLMIPGAKGSEGRFVQEVMGCFLYGSAAALPVLGALAVLQRLPPTRTRMAALTAAGAGLGGVLALQMHCPVALRDHLLLGHATVPLATILLIVAGRALLGRR